MWRYHEINNLINNYISVLNDLKKSNVPPPLPLPPSPQSRVFQSLLYKSMGMDYAKLLLKHFDSCNVPEADQPNKNWFN